MLPPRLNRQLGRRRPDARSALLLWHVAMCSLLCDVSTGATAPQFAAIGKGYCRPESKYPNHYYHSSLTRAQCVAACVDDAHCQGYARRPAAEAGWCYIYGTSTAITSAPDGLGWPGPTPKGWRFVVGYSFAGEITQAKGNPEFTCYKNTNYSHSRPANLTYKSKWRPFEMCFAIASQRRGAPGVPTKTRLEPSIKKKINPHLYLVVFSGLALGQAQRARAPPT